MDFDFNSIVTILLALLILTFFISMLVNAATNPKLDDTIRIFWCLCIMLVPVSAVIYYGYVYDGRLSVKDRIDKALGLK